jgi:hypothetical protein
VDFIEKDNGPGIGKRLLGGREIDAMAGDIQSLLGPVPREPHTGSLNQIT